MNALVILALLCSTPDGGVEFEQGKLLPAVVLLKGESVPFDATCMEERLSVATANRIRYLEEHSRDKPWVYMIAMFVIGAGVGAVATGGIVSAVNRPQPLK